MCPKGDDPLTETTQYRKIRVVTSATGGYLQGSFRLRFDDQYFDFPADGSLDAETCNLLVESMENVDFARCTVSAPDGHNGQIITIEFRKFPVHPVENNIYYHDGDPPLSHFSCDTSNVRKTEASGISCVVTDIVTGSNIPGE
jgi:hypothetical protein